MKKVWNYVIEVKEGFVPRKEQIYLLLRKERENIYEFIKEQFCRKERQQKVDDIRLQVFK